MVNDWGGGVTSMGIKVDVATGDDWGGGVTSKGVEVDAATGDDWGDGVALLVCGVLVPSMDDWGCGVTSVGPEVVMAVVETGAAGAGAKGAGSRVIGSSGKGGRSLPISSWASSRALWRALACRLGSSEQSIKAVWETAFG